MFWIHAGYLQIPEPLVCKCPPPAKYLQEAGWTNSATAFRGGGENKEGSPITCGGNASRVRRWRNEGREKGGEVMRIPALTLWQPWAAVIAAGFKLIENRPWLPPPSIRGERIAIHAGMTFEAGCRYDELDDDDPLKNAMLHTPDLLLDARGAVLATAIVAGQIGGETKHIIWKYRSHETGEFITSSPTNDDLRWREMGQIGWLLHDVRLLREPFTVRGHQGIWYVNIPDELLAEGSR